MLKRPANMIPEGNITIKFRWVITGIFKDINDVTNNKINDGIIIRKVFRFISVFFFK